MTFYFGLLTAVPEQEAVNAGGFPPDRTEIRKVWRIEHVLDLSAIKENMRSESFRWNPAKFRAKVYLLDLLYPQLTKYIEKNDIILVPKFVMYPDDVKHMIKEEQLIHPLSIGRHRPLPTFEFMEVHNSALKEGRQQANFNDLRELGSPFMWIACTRVYEMLSQGSSETRKLAMNDKSAYAFLSHWEHMFLTFGDIGGRVIFLFGSAAQESMPIGEF